MMNALFSLLQEEVSPQINDFMYLSDLDKHKDPKKTLERIKASVDALILSKSSLDELLNEHKVEVLITERRFMENVHAQMIYSEGKEAIWINPIWLKRYEKYMDTNSAKRVHLAHELYHILENKYDEFWYRDEPYRLRCQISETSAMYYSQCIANLAYHPRLYEYQYGVDVALYTRDALVASMKEGMK